MVLDAGVEPCGGVAEALAAVFAPLTGAPAAVAGSEGGFAPLGGPPELADDRFSAEQGFERPAERVAGPGPNEMEEFMDEDARKLGGGAVEGDAAFAKKRPGMDGAAPVAQARGSLQANGLAVEFGQTGSEGESAAMKGGAVGEKKGRHSMAEYRPGDQKFNRSEN